MIVTPHIQTRGFFKFKSPWVAKQGVVYTVIAIRTFTELFRQGEDVYEKYYKSVGVINGANINGSKFSFDEEVLLHPSIVIFSGTDGSTMYVPSTFIAEIPSESSVSYSEVLLTISLGPLPDYLDIELQVQDVVDYAKTRFNVETHGYVGNIPLLSNPSFEEHALMEQTRLGKPITAPPVVDPTPPSTQTPVEVNPPEPKATTQMLLDDTNQRIKEQDEIIKSLIAILDDNGLMAVIS